MKVLPIQRKIFNNNKIVNKIKNHNIKHSDNKPVNTAGAIGGLCTGGVLGYAASIFSFIAGIKMGIYGAIATIVAVSGLGAYLGNKIEEKLNNKE